MNLTMNQKRIQLPTYLFTLSLLMLFSISVNAQNISMSPTRLFFSGNPGEAIEQTVSITNGSANTVSFTTNVMDWYRDETGEKIYSDVNTLAKSNGAWLSIPEAQFTIEPGATKNIQLTLNIPQGASASDVTNSMLFFSQIGQQEDTPQAGMGIGLRVLFEFGLHIYNTPPANKTQDLEFTAVDDLGNVSQAGVAHRRIQVKIKNEGNTISDSTVEMELTNKDSGEEIKLAPIGISMLPDAEQLINFDLPADIKGSYSGVSFIKMGGTADMRIAEKDFEFK